SSQAIQTSFTLDTTPPVLSFTGIEDENGAPDLSGTINDETPTFTGTASEQAQITLLITQQDGSTLRFSSVADEDGNWSVNVTPALVDGNYTVQIVATDAAGNSSPAIQSSFTLDTTPPALSFTGIEDENGAPDLFGTINDDTPPFTGTASEQAQITLLITQEGGSTLRFSSVADEDGNWSVNVTPALVDGNYTVQIVATDAAGNSSQVESSFSLTKDPSFSATDMPDEDEIGLEPLPLDVGDEDPSSNISDSEIEAAETLALAAAQENSVLDVQPQENQATESTVQTGGVQETAPQEAIAQEGISDTFLESKVFSGQAEPESQVNLSIAGKDYQATADDDGDWCIKASFESTGNFDYKLSYQDEQGKAVEETGSFIIHSVKINTEAPLSVDADDTEKASSVQDSSVAPHVEVGDLGINYFDDDQNTH
ncbi:MAG: Ig-like domain-containing protein, partial [Enterovibrio sp.]